MTDVLIYGVPTRAPDLRHAIPLAIGDPILYVERGGEQVVLSNLLERDRIARVLPDARQLLPEELGWRELLASGRRRDEIMLELLSRAVARIGVTHAIVPPDLPVQAADRLRADGVALDVDGPAFALRRRHKSQAELDGIRRAQAAAEAGMAAAAERLRAATIEGDRLVLDGEVLTAEALRHAIRTACTAAGAPAPADIMVVSAWSGGGHDSGSGPLPAHLPIEIDLWPEDEQTGCWADMTRTFVVGEVSSEVATARDVVRAAIEAARALAAPGVTGRALYDAAADVVEAAGHPTQRTKTDDRPLSHGFYFALGHGVGLEVHEGPGLGLAGHDPLVAGDVIALEPGIEGMPYGGVRLEDLVLVMDDGCETLTRYPYGLAP